MAARPRTERRRWSETFKKSIVAKASQPDVTVAQIADRHDLDAKRISKWKVKLGSGAAFVPVEVTDDDDNVSMSTQQLPSCIEIDVPCCTRV